MNPMIWGGIVDVRGSRMQRALFTFVADGSFKAGWPMSASDKSGSDISEQELHRVTVSDLYSEAGNNFRNYSQCSLNVRLAVIAQGLVLLTGCGYTVVNHQEPFFLILSVFGLLFTFLLFLLHSAYLGAADVTSRIAAEIEKQSGFKRYGPFYQYRRRHFSRYRRFAFRLITMHAAFTAIAAAFLICLIYWVFWVWK